MRPKSGPDGAAFLVTTSSLPEVKVPTSISLFGNMTSMFANMTFALSPTSTRIGTISQESGEACALNQRPHTCMH